MLSVHMLSQFRLSVCPSVTRVYQSKMVEVKIVQFETCENVWQTVSNAATVTINH